MRQAGSLSSREDAERLCDYLLTEGIETRAEEDDGQWVLWVYDEEQLDRAKRELEQFVSAPTDARFEERREDAHNLRKREAAEQERARKQHINMRKRWLNSSTRGQPATMVLIAITVGFGLLTGFSLRPGPVSQWLYMSLPHVFSGQVWRLVTPIFLHGDLLHIGFNLLWLYSLGGMVEARRGPTRLLLLILASAIFSNLVQAIWVGPAFGGMSGVNYALFGYIWMKNRYEPGSGMVLSQTTVMFLLGWLLLGFTGIMNMANGAHLGGLIAGVVAGAAPHFLKLKRR